MIIENSLPDLMGRSVLDVGAWDGKWSFWAESAGAAKVVALDHYVWRLDGHSRRVYYEQCAAEGLHPDSEMIDRGFLVDSLPGKHGFDLIHDYLDSKVEAVVGDLMSMDLDELGQFDVVFYFGVLYHMTDPLGALRRLRQVTGSVAVIETLAIDLPAYPTGSLLEFYPGGECGGDYGNWFAPSASALVGMCLAAGFRKAEIVAQTPVGQVDRGVRRILGRLGGPRPITPQRVVARAYR
jgi:tRNA (mo5U34)-methyltransferase